MSWPSTKILPELFPGLASDEDTYSQKRHRENCRIAVTNGFKVLKPRSDQVFLDFDGENDLIRYGALRGLVTSGLSWGIRREERWRSKSGNWHYVLTLGQPMEKPPELAPAARMAIAVALGSDPKRLLVHLPMVLVGEEECLFQPPGAVVEVLVDEWTEWGCDL